jgi:hypothetical protein
MSKPPPATPHSDIDGVHRDEKRNTDTAAELGQSGKELKEIQDEKVAKPPYSDDKENEDDRTR